MNQTLPDGTSPTPKWSDRVKMPGQQQFYHGLLPERDEHLARFEVWLAAKLDAVASPAVRAPVEQFATWHHLRRALAS